MVHSSTGDFWTFLGTVLYPFLAIWRLISNFLFSNPPPAQTSVRAAALESSNLASSGNSERRYLFVFSPFAKYVSNAQCLIQNEKFCYGYFAFSLYQGENPTCSGKLNTWVFSAIFLKPIPWKATFTATDFIILFIEFSLFHNKRHIFFRSKQ